MGAARSLHARYSSILDLPAASRFPQHSLLSTVPISASVSAPLSLLQERRESRLSEERAPTYSETMKEGWDDACDESDASDQSATESVKSFDTDIEVWTVSPPPQPESSAAVEGSEPETSSPDAVPPQESTVPTLPLYAFSSPRRCSEVVKAKPQQLPKLPGTQELMLKLLMALLCL